MANTQLITIDKNLCTCCGVCMDVCVSAVLGKNIDTMDALSPSRCILCGHCKAICPENAIVLRGLDPNEFEPLPEKNNLFTPDQLQTFFRSRRSIRKYKNTPVETDKLKKIIEAGRFAPTGGNRQPIEYVVVHTPKMMGTVLAVTVDTLAEMARHVKKKIDDTKKDLKRLSVRHMREQFYADLWLNIKQQYNNGTDRLFYHAPVLIASHVDPEMATTPGVDAGISSAHMVLMAESIGLGSCFCGFFVLAVEQNHKLKQILQIPEKNRTQLSFMIGYPDVSFLRLTGRNSASVTWL
jgi:nitroreductase/NAD-dependent dihydropyrimidine dehydrogenase PreA subunit